jgi:hypothetical protein
MFEGLSVLSAGGAHSKPPSVFSIGGRCSGSQSVKLCQAASCSPGNDSINVNNAGKNFFMGMKKKGERDED